MSDTSAGFIEYKCEENNFVHFVPLLFNERKRGTKEQNMNETRKSGTI